LVTSLRNSAPHGIRDAGVTRELWLINHAYAAGADQELEACKQYMHDQDWFMSPTLRMAELHNARRPKPPSLKEQALKALGPEPLPETGPTGDAILNIGSIECHRTIRRALEALDD
jgi:hypothetical protein